MKIDTEKMEGLIDFLILICLILGYFLVRYIICKLFNSFEDEETEIK